MNNPRLAQAFTALLLTLFLSACVAPVQPSLGNPENTETLFQVSTLDALRVGIYEGAMTVGELKRKGDFGLGTFDGLDGEMVAVDGQVYRVDDQGTVHVADDGLTTPFAAVTFFSPDGTVSLGESFSCAQLRAYLDALLPSDQAPYAIQVDDEFAALTVRSVPKQQEPYPSLADAIAEQVVFEEQDITGSMIGFRLPDYLDGVNAVGYHFHFLSEDHQVGGHVLDCQTTEAAVAFDTIDGFQMEVPQNPSFRNAPISEEAGVEAETESLAVFGAYGTAIEEPWNQVIHQALVAAQASDDIDYTYADAIGYAGDIDSVLRTAIAELAPDIILGDAFGNELAVYAVAQENPDIAFVFGSDEGPHAPNISVFDSWTREPAYLGGMLAGGTTQSNVIGVVAGFPEGSVNQVVNAFIAGAKSVNPDVEVKTAFIDSWFDLEAAAEAARGQMGAGADVIFAERAGVIEEAAKHGVYSIGNMVDQREIAPDYVLSSVVWNMDPTVNYVLAQVRNNSYSAQNLSDLITLATRGALLAPINSEVVGGVRDGLAAQIESKRAEIVAGRFHVPVDESRPPASRDE